MDPVTTPGGDSIRATGLQLQAAGNGRQLSGLAVPYGVLAEIKDKRGHYQEMIAQGAFTQALATTRPRMLFEHGQDTRTGKTPIGSFDRVWEEQDGLHVSGELFDNELVRPLADAARAGELPGWSIHFRTREDGKDENWVRAKGWDIRTVKRADLPEISLVNFGAYPTTVSVRSSVDELADRSDADGSDGGNSSDGESENDKPDPQATNRIRDRIWRMKRIIRG